MNDSYFNDNYGVHIRNAARYNNILGTFPYVSPLSNYRIGITDSEIDLCFDCSGFVYPGAITGVFYKESKIAFFPLIDPQSSLISFQFLGCYMAKFCFNGKYYGCHIFCSTGNFFGRDCKAIWNRFVIDYAPDIKELVLFQPTDGKGLICHETIKRNKEVNNDKRFQVCGLITPDNRMYSVCLDTSDWTSKCILEHHGCRDTVSGKIPV